MFFQQMHLYTHTHTHTFGEDDSRKHLGMKISSNSSLYISFFGSSNKSFQDDFDDLDFPYPFYVEDDDVIDQVVSNWLSSLLSHYFYYI